MNNESLDHGDLFWVDLNPFFNEYVLAKVIDHSYFRETHRLGSPYYIYVYDYFVDDVNASIPKKVDRHLYVHPFNCKMYFYDGLWRLMPIRNEDVCLAEIVDQVMIHARGGIIRDQVDLIFSDVNLTTLDIEYDVDILHNLELFDFYVDKGIQARVLLDVMKNREINCRNYKGKESEELAYFNYFLDRIKSIMHFPSYHQIEPEKRGFIDFDWRLLEKSKYKKDFRDMKSRDLSENPKFIFHYSVYYVFGLLDPVFRKYGYRATGRYFVSLLASLIYTQKILNTPIEIVDRVENSIFRLRFMREEDRNKLVDFFHEEILDPHKVEKYLPLMDRDYIELFSGLKTDVAETVEHITDYQAEKSVSKYLFKYKYTKGTQKIYGLNINADVLYEDYTGLLMEYSDLPNGEFWAELMEAEASSMFNLTLEEDYEIDEEASNCDMHFYKKKDRDSIYKHLVENLKDKNSIKELLDRNDFL